MSNDFRDGETDPGDAEPPPWLCNSDTLHEADDAKRRIQELTEADYLRVRARAAARHQRAMSARRRSVAQKPSLACA